MKKLLVSLKGRLLKSTSAISICSLVYHIHTRMAVDAKPILLQISMNVPGRFNTVVEWQGRSFKKGVKIKLRIVIFIEQLFLNNYDIDILDVVVISHSLFTYIQEERQIIH